MFLTILALLSALSVSSVAIWYSVVGLMAIFSGATTAIAVMGITLEVGKLVATVWLHQNWHTTRKILKVYLTTSVIVLMFITSMGIFGFLSKAHIEQTALTTDQYAQIETVDEQIARSVSKIGGWENEIERLNKGQDVRVDTLIIREQDALKELYERISKDKKQYTDQSNLDIESQNDRLAQAQKRKDEDQTQAGKQFKDGLIEQEKYNSEIERARRSELGVASRVQREIIAIKKELRAQHKRIDSMYTPQIQGINDRIAKLREQATLKTEDIDTRVNELDGLITTELKKQDGIREEKRGLESGYRKLEAEVGPVKYIAALIYGQSVDQQLLEEAVRLVTIIIIFVFDPFAVFMLLAASEGFIMWRREKDENASRQPEPPVPTPPDPTPEVRSVPVVDVEPVPEPEPEPAYESVSGGAEDLANEYLDKPEDIAQEYIEPEPEPEPEPEVFEEDPGPIDEPPIQTAVSEELEIKVVDREPQQAIIQDEFEDAHYAVTDEQRQEIIASFDDSFNSATTDEITSDEVHQKDEEDVEVNIDDQKKDIIIERTTDLPLTNFLQELQKISVAQKEDDTETDITEELKEEISQKLDEQLGTDVSEDVKTAVYQRQQVSTGTDAEVVVEDKLKSDEESNDVTAKDDVAVEESEEFSTSIKDALIESADTEVSEDVKTALYQKQEVATEAETEIEEELESKADFADPIEGRFSAEDVSNVSTTEDVKTAVYQKTEVATEADTTVAEDLQTSEDNTDNVQETEASTHTLDERKEDAEDTESFDEVVGVTSTDTVQIEEVLANADQDTLDQVYAELEKDKKSKIMGSPWTKTAGDYDSSVKAKVTEEELQKRRENAKGDGWLDG